MLKPAALYNDALKRELIKAEMESCSKYRYYSRGFWSVGDVSMSTQLEHQYVSIDSTDSIIGYMYAEINRSCHYIESIACINFSNKSMVFSIDMKRFLLKMLFDYKYNKIKFSCVSNSPLYDTYVKLIRFINRYYSNLYGYISGVSIDNFKCVDGTMYDETMFEIIRERK